MTGSVGRLRGGGNGRRLLTLADREEISRGLAVGLSNKDIAVRVGRCPSVVSRERRRHGGASRYRAVRAERAAARSRLRPKTRKLDRSPAQREHVLARIGGSWSPQQVAAGLRTAPVSGEGGPVMVSHQAIYDWIYARPKGGCASWRPGRSRCAPVGRPGGRSARSRRPGGCGSPG